MIWRERCASIVDRRTTLRSQTFLTVNPSLRIVRPAFPDSQWAFPHGHWRTRQRGVSYIKVNFFLNATSGCSHRIRRHPCPDNTKHAQRHSGRLEKDQPNHSPPASTTNLPSILNLAVNTCLRREVSGDCGCDRPTKPYALRLTQPNKSKTADQRTTFGRYAFFRRNRCAFRLLEQDYKALKVAKAGGGLSTAQARWKCLAL